ncbi:MAG: diphosphomevalonate decarboxylase [Candidatus Aenigmarchaeota archaeon]|nr:diphosphomevalonate decarboxylase [Candidatus Aenigmarchaeota archaeon]
MKVTAIANSNIALTKYWGKRDKKMMLPFAGSVSMTLDSMFTKTTVEFDSKYDRDIFVLNGKELKDGEEYEEVVDHLNLIREMAKVKEHARVVSENNFPTAAGLASSASGFAALSLAGSKAAGLNLDERGLSILSRRGSGSASRSIAGGFVHWHRGEKEDGSDSFAEQIASPDHWDIRMVVAVTTKAEKKIKSRAGMAQSVDNCPYYSQWVKECEKDIENVKKAVRKKDFKLLGKTAEMNCLKMHAVMMTTSPPIIYWTPSTIEVVTAVLSWREEGLECYFTIDGGPQVKIICQGKDAEEIERRLKNMGVAKETHICKIGGPAKVVEDHLF